LSDTNISNIIDWFKFSLPKEENNILDHPDRHTIAIYINEHKNDDSGTGVSETPGILYSGVDYGSETAIINRRPVKLNEPVVICTMSSKYKKNPSGDYEYDEQKILNYYPIKK